MEVSLSESKPPVVHVSGEVDLGNVQSLINALDKAIPASPEGVVIDMADVIYIDSAGIQAVISAYQRLRATEGNLVLVLANSDVQAIFALIHPELLPGFLVVSDLQQGLSVFSAASA